MPLPSSASAMLSPILRRARWRRKPTLVSDGESRLGRGARTAIRGFLRLWTRGFPDISSNYRLSISFLLRPCPPMGSRSMNVLRRIVPAIILFFLSPLVAEFLLGDLTLAQLPALVALAPFYGGGAILIREILRRTGRSWPSFLFLAFAYALIEEGIADQSLFNPDYLHLRLLDYGWVPALGTSVAWTVYVLGIHIAWSLAVPIGLTESFFADRRAEPWLGRIGLGIVALLYCAG